MNKILTGLTACSGTIRGKAFVAKGSSADLDEMEQGDILVLKHSSPEYYAYYLKASAIITELGGVTCHAASLARDLNIPCIVSVGDALKYIQTGCDLTVDANEGKVYVRFG